MTISPELTKLIDDDGFVVFEPKAEHVGQGGRMGFLSTDAWLDEDGYHVWVAHDCRGSREVAMLPWPTWQASTDGAGSHRNQVRPSFYCGLCDTHTFVKINRRLDCFTIKGPHTTRVTAEFRMGNFASHVAALAAIDRVLEGTGRD